MLFRSDQSNFSGDYIVADNNKGSGKTEYKIQQYYNKLDLLLPSIHINRRLSITLSTKVVTKLVTINMESEGVIFLHQA